MEEQKQKISPLIQKQDCELVSINLYDRTLTRQIKNDLYQLESIAKYCNINAKIIGQFLNSQRFNIFFNAVDKDFEIPSYVYLIKRPTGIKIGRTFNIDKRYNLNDINIQLKRLVFVKYVDRCEKALKKAFSKYEKTKGLEEFDVNIRIGLQIFDEVVEKYKSDKKIENDYIVYYKDDLNFGNSVYVSSKVIPIIISAFTERSLEDATHDIIITENTAKSIDKNDYLSLVREEGNEFIYWGFRNTIIIINQTTQEVNLSRLWKTTLKNSNKNKSTKLSKFLKINVISGMIKKYPELKPIKRTFKNKPLLNGKYAPLVYIHYVYSYLDIDYAYEVGKYVTGTFIKPPGLRGGARLPPKEWIGLTIRRMLEKYQNFK